MRAHTHTHTHTGFPGGSVVKSPPANPGDRGRIPGSGRSPGGGHGKPLQYSYVENPMDSGAQSPQSIGSQRVGHNSVTKQQYIQTQWNIWNITQPEKICHLGQQEWAGSW